MRILYADKWQILNLDRLWILGTFLPHCLFLLVSHSHLWISHIGWRTPLCCWSNPMCLSTNASERPNEAVLLKGNRAQTHNVKTSYCSNWDQCARQNRWPHKHKCVDTTETHIGQWQTRMFEKRKKKNIVYEKVLVIFGLLLQGCQVVYPSSEKYLPCLLKTQDFTYLFFKKVIEHFQGQKQWQRWINLLHLAWIKHTLSFWRTKCVILSKKYTDLDTHSMRVSFVFLNFFFSF